MSHLHLEIAPPLRHDPTGKQRTMRMLYGRIRMEREPRMMLWLMKRLRFDVPADGQRRAIWLNAVLYGLEFALVFGALKWVLDRATGVPFDAGDIGRSMAFCGSFFGVLMAWMPSRAR
ncbi:hypothetical protein KQ945_12400 [Bacillus subtilis subsp. subtilis]|nr:hypothetical protein [Bacillus subtilis subsp. subtilis]